MAYKIIFFGTSEFAVPSLRSLSTDPRYEIVAVVTQPDRPVGRHAILTPPPVKQHVIASEAKQSPPSLLQPEKLSELKERLPSADAFVIVSYGKILPQWLLDLPRNGVINVHPSLLPKWRGPTPIQAAIAAGDSETGVTIMKIDAEMDHGPILAQTVAPIRKNDTGGTLHDRLADIGAEILPNVLADYLEHKIEPTEQDHSSATYCKILTRDDGKLNFSKTSEELERLVRAYDPWPGTWMEHGGKRLKVLAARIASKGQAGFIVECGGNTLLELVTVQPEGKKTMSGSDFLRGMARKS